MMCPNRSLKKVDNPLYSVNQGRQGVFDVYPFANRSLSESYDNGELEIHFHTTALLAFGKFLQRQSCDVCITFKRAPKNLRFGRCRRRRRKLCTDVGIVSKQRDNLVLVHYVKVVKNPQTRPKWVRSMVRLQSLNQCPSPTREPSDTPFFGFFELASVGENGKLRSSVTVERNRSRKIRQRPRDMVEGGSGVVDTISDDKPPLGEWDVSKPEIINIVRRILFLVANESATFTFRKGSQIALKRFEVSFRPSDLRTASV